MKMIWVALLASLPGSAHAEMTMYGDISFGLVGGQNTAFDGGFGSFYAGAKLGAAASQQLSSGVEVGGSVTAYADYEERGYSGRFEIYGKLQDFALTWGNTEGAAEYVIGTAIPLGNKIDYRGGRASDWFTNYVYRSRGDYSEVTTLRADWKSDTFAVSASLYRDPVSEDVFSVGVGGSVGAAKVAVALETYDRLSGCDDECSTLGFGSVAFEVGSSSVKLLASSLLDGTYSSDSLSIGSSTVLSNELSIQTYAGYIRAAQSDVSYRSELRTVGVGMTYAFSDTVSGSISAINEDSTLRDGALVDKASVRFVDVGLAVKF